MTPDGTTDRTTVDEAEIAHFSAIAERNGVGAGRRKFAALHRLNPLRIGFIKDEGGKRFGRDARDPRGGLAGLDVLRYRLRRRAARRTDGAARRDDRRRRRLRDQYRRRRSFMPPRRASPSIISRHHGRDAGRGR